MKASILGLLRGGGKTAQSKQAGEAESGAPARAAAEETRDFFDTEAVKAQVRASKQAAAELEVRLEAGMLEWLAAHGPDDWHAVARSWNWDRGYAPLLWILEQPDCDRATATLLFWRACPDSVLTSETLEDAQRSRCADSWQVATAVLDRLDGAGFARAEIALDAEADPPWSRETWERLQEKYGVDAPVPDWMHGSLPGREVPQRFTEGLPRPMVEWVYPDWPEGWGD